MTTSIKLAEKYRRLTQIHKELKAEIENRKRADLTKDELITIAGHELKTPLTIIKGYLHLLENSSSEMLLENTRKYLARTLVQVGKLELLVTDLLDTSKIESGHLNMVCELVDFDELVETIVETIRQIHPLYTIALTLGSDAIVQGDRIRLEQVIINYLTNAIKYSPDSFKIGVSTGLSEGILLFKVTDSGIGIPLEKQARIFHKFYRVEDPEHRFSGLGMGLFISAEIIQHHKGKVWVMSEPDKGSTFFFTLPVSSLKVSKPERASF